jgi:hypothetical protein
MANWGDIDFETSQPARIPVGQTIGQAYNFAIGNFFKLLGVMWLPYAVLIAAMGGMGLLLDIGVLTRLPGPLTPTNAIVFSAFLFAASILLFIPAEGVVLEALGERRGTRLLYFSLSKQVWLLVAALAITTMLFAAAVTAIVLAIGAADAALRATGGALETTADAKIGIGIAAGIGLTVFFCTFLYMAIRQVFLLAPVIVVEKTSGIRRAWKLGKDNFWRMFTIYVAVVAPLLLVHFALMFAIPTMLGLAPFEQNPTTHRVAIYYARFLLFYFLIFSTALYGLVYGAQTFAYRSLVPAVKPEDVF